MAEIEEKLKELWTLLQNIPNDCKGAHQSQNRYRYMKIRMAIHTLIPNEEKI